MGLEDELKAQTQECFQGLSQRLQLLIASTCSPHMVLKHQVVYLAPLPLPPPPSCSGELDVSLVLPDHLVALILSKLTSRDLLSARLVCRSWNRLIDDADVTPWSVEVAHHHIDRPAFRTWIENPRHSKGVFHIHLKGGTSSHLSNFPLRGNAWSTEHLSVPRRMGFLTWLPHLENLSAFKSTLPLDRPTEARLIWVLPASLKALELLLRDQDSVSCINFRKFTGLKALSLHTVRYGSLSLPLDCLPSSLQSLNCKLEGFGGDWAAGQCPTRTAAALPDLETLASLEVCANQSLADCAMAFTKLRELELTLCPFPHEVGDLFNMDLAGISNLARLEKLRLDLHTGLTSVAGLGAVGSLTRLTLLHISAPRTDMVQVLFSREANAQPALLSTIREFHLYVRDNLELGMIAAGLAHAHALEDLKLSCRHLAASEDAVALCYDKPALKRVSVLCRMAVPNLGAVVSQFFPRLQHRRHSVSRGASGHPAPLSPIEFRLQCDQTIIARIQAYNLQKRAKRRGVRLQLKSCLDARC